jgi:hypothetical protein
MNSFDRYLMSCRAFDTPRGDLIRDMRDLIENGKFPEVTSWRDFGHLLAMRDATPGRVFEARKVWAQYQTSIVPVEKILTPVESFAEANGWKVGAPFNLDLLASGKKHHGGDNSAKSASGLMPWFDHPEFFRISGRPVAIVAHNYVGRDEKLREYVAERRRTFVLHEPPAGHAASWYLPGEALPQGVTRPDITSIVWPTPKQMVATAAAHAEEQARIQTDRERRRERREQHQPDPWE